MRKVIACSVFNDKDSFKRHLSSLPKVNKDFLHIVIDGRYRGFNYPSSLSNDGTRELALLNNSMLIDAPDLNEVEKRQIYFNLASKSDVIIAVDSDEYLEGDWDLFCKELDDFSKLIKGNNPLCLGIELYNPLHSKWDPRPRIWFNAYNIKMGPRHFEYINTVNKQPLYFSYIVKHLKINHNYKYRYESYNILREEYQNMLIANENHL